MTISIGILIYAMLWVVILFLVLPWGVHLSDAPVPGHATSAPEKSYIGPKLLVTSLLASLLWIVTYLVLEP